MIQNILIIPMLLFMYLTTFAKTDDRKQSNYIAAKNGVACKGFS